MVRMATYMSRLDYASNAESLAKSDLSEQQILGLVASRNHYGDVDLEHYRLNVMQALDIAEGKLDASTKPAPQRQLIDETEVKDEKDESTDDLESVITDIISKLDQGDGVEFETILVNAEARGFQRSIAEEKLTQFGLLNQDLLWKLAGNWWKLARNYQEIGGNWSHFQTCWLIFG